MRQTLQFICASIIACLMAFPSFGQIKDDNWDGSAYCSYKKYNPRDILEEGNNFEIVLSLLRPQSYEDLNAAGVSCDIKQLKTLKRDGFIKRNPDGTWESAIVIFDEAQTSALRSFSKSLSGTIYSSIKEDFFSFVNMLKENGWEDNAYSICFSYILDDKMWNHIIAPSEMESHHSWKGCVWYLYGKRDGIVPGTNQIGAFSQTWEESIQSRIDYTLLIDVANSLSFKGNPTVSGDVRGRAENAGLCDSEGKPLFPVIHEKEQKDLVSLADAIGKGIADEMKLHINECNLLSSIKGKGVAEVILSHELIWDIIEQLEADGIIRCPTFLQPSAGEVPVDMSKLVYISY